MTDNLEDIGHAAVDNFINTWNSRDPEAWAGSLNFPHVRPGPFGPLPVAADAREYISRVDFDRVIATGWDHSEWDAKHVMHTSPRKIHVVGQWSRYNAGGEKLLTNPVVYIVTNLDGHWGVQSRFSADYAGEEDTTSLESRAFKLVETFIMHLNARNTAACAELLNYPHFDVGIGKIDATDSAIAFELPATSASIESMMALQTGKRSINLALDLAVIDDSGSRPMQAVINVTQRDDHLGIQAWSLLDPNAEADEDQS